AAAQGKLQMLGTMSTPDGEAAPVLLAKADHLPKATAAALTEIDPTNVVVLGGETVIGADVRAKVQEAAPNADLTEIEGEGRYATSANLATTMWGTADTVYVASGEHGAFSDALTSGALAGTIDAPVLLTKGDSVPQVTADDLESLGASKVVVVGGPATISDEVYAELGGTDRLGGANKWETAAAIADEYAADVPTVYIADGYDSPDALAASSLAGSQDVPVVVVKGAEDGDAIPQVVKDALVRLSPENVVIVGGPSAVGSNVEEGLKNDASWE